MILLDTTVVSAWMWPDENPGVLSWLNQQDRRQFATTSITVLELWYGIACLDHSHRRRDLEARFDNSIRGSLKDRIVVFDAEAAMATAELTADRKRAGMPRDLADSQIAGIALSRKAILATRNIRHFDDLPLQIINPWKA